MYQIKSTTKVIKNFVFITNNFCINTTHKLLTFLAFNHDYANIFHVYCYYYYCQL